MQYFIIFIKHITRPLALFICIILISSGSYAITLEKPLANPQAEIRAKRLFHEIRCMVCAGESIADSRAKLATDLRHYVRNNINSGKSDAQILDELRNAYGDEILMRPPLQANTFALWIGPLMIFSAALITIIFIIKRRKM